VCLLAAAAPRHRMSFNNHLQKFSVVHSDRPNHAYLNPTRQTDARGTSDLRETLKDLQYETKKGEIEDMIWEVDETLSNAVSYLEFNIMYCRIRQTGGKTLQSVTQSRSLFLVLYSVFYFPLTSLIFFSSSMHADPFGMELRKLFTVCDFMMNDKNGDGCVTMDEAVQVAVLLQLVIP